MSPRNLLAGALRRCVGPWVPQSARLAFDYRIARLRGCEPEIGRLDRLGPNRGVAIDAGANEGLYTYRLAGLYDHVHSFEINPAISERLRAAAPANVTVHSEGLSSVESEAVLRIPFVHGRPLNGWASLETGNCPDADRYEEIKVATRPLDSFGIEGVTFVKADVEGHELELLAGARETLRRDRPIVFLEIKRPNLAAARAFFAELGYCERSILEQTGLSPSAENYLFGPAPAPKS
jgi:FkbM family methyltransferase